MFRRPSLKSSALVGKNKTKLDDVPEAISRKRQPSTQSSVSAQSGISSSSKGNGSAEKQPKSGLFGNKPDKRSSFSLEGAASIFSGSPSTDNTARIPALLFNDLSVEIVQQAIEIDQRKLNTLHLAIYQRKLKQAVSLLNKGKDIDKTDTHHGLTALHIAVELRNIEFINILLNKNPTFPIAKAADVHIPNSEGRTALILATIRGDYDIVELLLRCGANPNSVDVLGCSALHYSILLESIDIFHFLIRSKASLAIIDKTSDSLLHHAIRLQRKQMALYLIERGHDVLIKNKTGMTPLHYAVKEGIQAVVSALLDHGAEPTSKDGFGLSALDYTKKSPKAIQDLLQSKLTVVESDKPLPPVIHQQEFAVEEESEGSTTDSSTSPEQSFTEDIPEEDENEVQETEENAAISQTSDYKTALQTDTQHLNWVHAPSAVQESQNEEESDSDSSDPVEFDDISEARDVSGSIQPDPSSRTISKDSNNVQTLPQRLSFIEAITALEQGLFDKPPDKPMKESLSVTLLRSEFSSPLKNRPDTIIKDSPKLSRQTTNSNLNSPAGLRSISGSKDQMNSYDIEWALAKLSGVESFLTSNMGGTRVTEINEPLENLVSVLRNIAQTIRDSHVKHLKERSAFNQNVSTLRGFLVEQDGRVIPDNSQLKNDPLDLAKELPKWIAKYEERLGNVSSSDGSRQENKSKNSLTDLQLQSLKDEVQFLKEQLSAESIRGKVAERELVVYRHLLHAQDKHSENTNQAVLEQDVPDPSIQPELFKDYVRRLEAKCLNKRISAEAQVEPEVKAELESMKARFKNIEEDYQREKVSCAEKEGIILALESHISSLTKELLVEREKIEARESQLQSLASHLKPQEEDEESQTQVLTPDVNIINFYESELKLLRQQIQDEADQRKSWKEEQQTLHNQLQKLDDEISQLNSLVMDYEKRQASDQEIENTLRQKLESQEKQISNLTKTCDEAQARLTEYVARENMRLSRSLNATSAVENASQIALTSDVPSARNSQTLLSVDESSILELRKSNKSLLDLVSQKKTDLTQLRLERDRLQDQVKALTRDNEKHVKTIDTLRNEATTYGDEIQALTAKLQQKSAEVNKIELMLSTPSPQLGRLEQENGQHLKMIESLRREAKSYVDDVQELTTSLQQTRGEVDELQLKISSHQAQIEDLERDNNEYLKTIDNLRRESKIHLDELQELTTSLQRERGNVGELQVKLLSHQSHIESLERENSQLRRETAVYVDQVQELTTRLQREMARQDGLQVNASSHQPEIEALKQENSQYLKTIDTLRREAQVYVNEVQELTEMLDRERRQADALQLKLSTLESHTTKQDSTECDSCKAREQDRNNETAHLHLQMTEKSQTIETLNCDIEQLRCTIQHLENELEVKNLKLEVKNDKIEKLEGELREKISSLGQQDQNHSRNSIQLDAVTKQLSDTTQKLEKLEEDSLEKEMIHAEKLSQLEQQLSHQSSQLRSKDDQIMLLKKDISSMVEEIQSLEATHQVELVQAKEHEISTLTKEAQSTSPVTFERQLHEEKAKVNAKEHEIHRLKQELLETTAELSSFTAEYEKLLDSLKQKESSKEKTPVQLQSKEAVDSEQSKSQHDIEECRNTIDRLQVELKQLLQERNSLEYAVNNKEDEVQKLNGKISELTQKHQAKLLHLKTQFEDSKKIFEQEQELFVKFHNQVEAERVANDTLLVQKSSLLDSALREVKSLKEHISEHDECLDNVVDMFESITCTMKDVFQSFMDQSEKRTIPKHVLFNSAEKTPENIINALNSGRNVVSKQINIFLDALQELSADVSSGTGSLELLRKDIEEINVNIVSKTIRDKLSKFASSYAEKIQITHKSVLAFHQMVKDIGALVGNHNADVKSLVKATSEDMSKKVETLQLKVQNANSKMVQMEAEKKALEAQIESLVASSTEEVERLTKEGIDIKTNAEKEIKHLKALLDQELDVSHELQSELEEKERKLADALKSSQNLADKYKEANGKSTELDSKLNILMLEKESLEEYLVEKCKVVEESHTKLQLALKRQADGLDIIRRKEETIDLLNQQVELLQRDKAQDQQKVQYLNSKISNLLKNEDELECVISSLKDQIAESELKCTSLEHKLQDISSRPPVDPALGDLANLKAELAEKQRQLLQSQEKIDELCQERDDLKGGLGSALKKHTAETRRLTVQFEEKSEELQSLQSEHSLLQRKFESIVASNKRQVAETQFQIESLTRGFEQKLAQKEIEYVTAKNELKEQIRSLQQHLTQSDRENGELENHLLYSTQKAPAPSLRTASPTSIHRLLLDQESEILNDVAVEHRELVKKKVAQSNTKWKRQYSKVKAKYDSEIKKISRELNNQILERQRLESLREANEMKLKSSYETQLVTVTNELYRLRQIIASDSSYRIHRI